MTHFSKVLISWYSNNKRDLPWRHTRNPYFIWLSEIILQQTRVAQGLVYFNKFVNFFPTVYDLASAKEEDVLRLWQGLGYYSRARNIHFTAKFVVNVLDGKFPDNYVDLLKLKGIGDYTASAISSFCYDEARPVLDGNVFRVVARYFGVFDNIAQASTAKIFKKILYDVIPKEGKSVNLFNQAIMEFGALNCKPKQPKCEECKLQFSCYSFENKMQNRLPVKVKKVKKRDRFFYYLLPKESGSLFMKLRKEKDIWSNLYDFPLIETSERTMELDFLLSSYLGSAVSGELLHEAKVHKLSHQNIYSFYIKLNSNSLHLDGAKLYSIDDIHKLPKPILIDNFLNAFYF